jgi:hypothetical protein
MRYLQLVLVTALALVAPSIASIAGGALTISIAQNAEALPIRVGVSIRGGSPPFQLHLTTDSTFETPLDEQLIAEQRDVTVHILSNRVQTITATVSDATGLSCTEQQLVGRQISQDEDFLLDAGRFGGDSGTGAWTQVTDLGDETYCSTTPLLMEMVDGKVRTRATWPGAYFFRVSPAGELVKVVVEPKSGAEIAIRGMCVSGNPHPFGFSYIDDHLAQMARDGVNAIQFIKVLEMQSVTDIEIRDPVADLASWDDSLFCGIRRAKAAGFTVMLRIMLSLDAPWPQCDNLMTGLHPRDWEAWFTKYEGIVLRYAALAQDAGVDIYLFADSLYTTFAFEARYRDLVARMRQVFGGALVVASGPWVEGGLNSVRFWDALDYVCITGSLLSMGDAPYEEALELNTDGLTAIYLGQFEREIAPVARRFQKPILWAEVYYSSVVGTTYSPNGVPFWGSGIQNAEYEMTPSYREQAKGYDAMLRVIEANKELFAGVFCLNWPFWDPAELLCCSKGTFIIRGTPAEEVFDTWWGTNRPGLLPGSSQSGECLVIDEFAPRARGGWELDGPWGTWREEVLHKGSLAEMSRIRVDFSNPGGDFFRLRYTLYEGRDLSSYQGIVVAASAVTPMLVRIELAMELPDHDWIGGFFSDFVKLGPETRLITLPFSSFHVTTELHDSWMLGHHDLNTAGICGISIWPVDSAGTFFVWSWGVGAYR